MGYVLLLIINRILSIYTVTEMCMFANNILKVSASVGIKVYINKFPL